MKLVLLVVLSVVDGIITARNAVKSSLMVYPCPSSKQLSAQFVTKKKPDEDNQYDVTFRISEPVDSKVNIKFDSDASINLGPPLNQAARVTESNKNVIVKFFKETDLIKFRVSGPHKYIVPHITSFNVNGIEHCNKTSIGYFDNLLFGKQYPLTNRQVKDNDSCGRRKITQSEMTADGVGPKSGFWPWHVIIKRLDRKAYENVCGGTLVSNSWVLTGFESFGYSVSDVIVYDDFKNTHLKNDIALLKLKSEVVFDDFIQPACLWNENISENLSSDDVYGNVVGWIYEEENDSSKSHNTTIPMVPEEMCINDHPEFYTQVVDDGMFCAGLENDTSAWYGDDGGGFYMFVPDDNSEENGIDTFGTWYVRGILSQIPSTNASSNTKQYAVFTDVAKHYEWIQKYI